MLRLARGHSQLKVAEPRPRQSESLLVTTILSPCGCRLCPRLMESKPFHSPSCKTNTQRCLLHQYTSSFHTAGKNSSSVEFSSSLQRWLQTSSPLWFLFGRFLFIHAHVELCHLERDFMCKMRLIIVVPQKDWCED